MGPEGNGWALGRPKVLEGIGVFRFPTSPGGAGDSPGRLRRGEASPGVKAAAGRARGAEGVKAPGPPPLPAPPPAAGKRKVAAGARPGLRPRPPARRPAGRSRGAQSCEPRAPPSPRPGPPCRCGEWGAGPSGAGAGARARSSPSSAAADGRRDSRDGRCPRVRLAGLSFPGADWRARRRRRRREISAVRGPGPVGGGGGLRGAALSSRTPAAGTPGLVGSRLPSPFQTLEGPLLPGHPPPLGASFCGSSAAARPAPLRPSWAFPTNRVDLAGGAPAAQGLAALQVHPRPPPASVGRFPGTPRAGTAGSGSGALCSPPQTVGSWVTPPSPHLRKKTIYRSLCLALALLVAITVFQRSLTPGQFLQEPPPPTLEPQRAQKPNGPLVNSNNFWKNLKDVATPTTMASQGPQAWDVTTTNCSANINLTQQSWFQGLEPQFRQFLFYRHCRYFPMLLNHPEKCRGDVYLLVVIKSVITQHDRREAIRQTWGHERESAGGGRGAVRTLFLLGTASKQEERMHYQQLLAYEDRLYGDILQWDFLDTFFNLTLKEIHFLKWLDIYCPHIPFIFKGDDDVFVNPTNLLEFLADRQPQENLFVGDVLQHARPIRRKDNKYYIPGALYSKASYPPYAGGGGFLMAGSLARRLHHACDTLELYPIDDVFLGMCLEVLGVQPTAHEGFKTFGISRNRNSRMNKEPCFFRAMLVVHKLLPPELLAMWGLVHSNLTCSRKLQVL
ncbi:UDP-GlcNAcbetaGal beta-1,3-N-acetylglucosaminyltransferase 7 [Plecturocebus cupreus]